MSRLYDTVEPSVIDDEILRKAVEEQGPKEEAGRIAKQEGVNYKDVPSLRLDFKNILKIDNLWQFERLTKLQLDNNIIEKIEGLDALVNLVWLDLSFNNIEVIEGLSNLKKLEDLTLYSNRISHLENMDALVNLHVLSAGNNKLAQLDNLIYLRRFKSLRTLNLSGCPVCEDPEYKLFTIAYLSQLVYLDFRLIDEGSRSKAHNLYENKLGELMHNENQTKKSIQEKKDREQQLQYEKDAYVEQLDGSHLFDSLYTEDPEGQKLALIPGLEEMMQDFRTKFVEICQKVFEFGLKEHKRRTLEVEEFQQCMQEAVAANKKLSTTEIDDFESYKRKLFAELVLLSDPSILETRISEYHGKVNDLWDVLMGLEMQLVDQLEDTIKDFERNLVDMMTSFVEHVQGLISQARELENMHNEKLLERSMLILEKVVKNELEGDLPDDIRMLFVDKETIVNAIGASHDVHLLKLDNREDEIVTRSGAWLTSLVAKLHAEEARRNRKRVVEVSNFVDHLREDVDSLDMHEQQS